MRVAEQDVRKDKPRLLSQCGDQPGRDARWRGLEGVTRVTRRGNRVERIDIVAARTAQRHAS